MPYHAHNKQHNISPLPRCGRRVALSALLICVMALQPFPSISYLAPQAARAEFTLKDEIKLGHQFYLMILSSVPTVQDPEVVAYCEQMLARLSQSIPDMPYPFKVTIIRNNSLNAFAVPGGYIFLHTGLITAMNHEAEVAGVLAHEIAHITRRHMAKRIENTQFVSILSLIGVLAGVLMGGDGAGAAIVGSVAAAQQAMLTYSRTDESEADQVGMNYFLTAGYYPERMVNAFNIIRRPQWVTGSEIPTYLSTHPAVNERVAALSARVKDLRLAPDAILPEDDSDFLRIQTLIRARYGDLEMARHFFDEWDKSGHKDLAALGLGILNERANRMTNAQAAFAQAITYRPDDQIFLREAGRFNYLHGDKNQAIAYLQKATAQNPQDYMALFYYARLLSDSDQQAEAVSYYKLVLRYQPEDPEVHYYYAHTLGKTKETFSAYLHLAFSALYANDSPRTKQTFRRLKNMAKTQKEKEDIAFFEKKYQERRIFWK